MPFIRYVEARMDREFREEAYRIYVSDSVYQFARGKALSNRYTDMLNYTPKDARTGDEIAQDIMARAGLELA